MDKQALKSTIILLRDEGMSFQEISDILRKDYNVKMSRQAVCGMYNRSTSDESLNRNKEVIAVTSDIINYKALGLTIKRIKDILDKNNYNISFNKLSDILNNNSELMNVVKEEQVNKVAVMLSRNTEIDNIVNSLEYKGEKPTTVVLKEIIEDATALLINKRATEILAKTYSLTEDRMILKNIISKYKLDITFRDIGSVLNNSQHY
jgi:DNA-binding transcriptional MerR regulator